MHSLSSPGFKTFYEYNEYDSNEDFSEEEIEDSCSSLELSSDDDQRLKKEMAEVKDIRRHTYERSKYSAEEKSLPVDEPTSLKNRVVKIEKVEESENSSLEDDIQTSEQQDRQRTVKIINRLTEENKLKDETIGHLMTQLGAIETVTLRRIAQGKVEATNAADRAYFREGMQRQDEKKWYSLSKKWTIAGVTISTAALIMSIAAVILIVILL